MIESMIDTDPIIYLQKAERGEYWRAQSSFNTDLII